MELVPAIVRRHPRATLVIVLVGIALLLFGILWFEPQKLFLEERVDEALPGMPAGSTGMEAEMEATEGGAPGSQVVMRGEFLGLEHATSGRALVVETGDGRRFLRFEGFETSNGPDLVVYLSSKEPSGPDDWYGYDEDFVDLGPLKGNIGDQNYLIPKGVDLDRYATAVVWCRRFTVGFAAASLR
jgi:hypothetical protein